MSKEKREYNLAYKEEFEKVVGKDNYLPAIIDEIRLDPENNSTIAVVHYEFEHQNKLFTFYMNFKVEVKDIDKIERIVMDPAASDEITFYSIYNTPKGEVYNIVHRDITEEIIKQIKEYFPKSYVIICYPTT